MGVDIGEFFKGLDNGQTHHIVEGDVDVEFALVHGFLDLLA